MDLKEILVCITNHNENENALYLKKIFSNYIETIIIDSKSNQVADEFDIKLENVYYTGLFNESFNQCSIKNKKYCFFIASDVYIDNIENIVSIIESLEDDIYIWAPSSKGQSHHHCKNFGSGGLREVPYVEGFLFLSNLDVMRKMIPIDLNKNKYGFGIDLLMGLNCVKRLKKKCVIDDRTEVYHKEGTGYDQSKALNDMYNWLLNDFDNISREYAVLYSKSPGYEKLLEYLKL